MSEIESAEACALNILHACVVEVVDSSGDLICNVFDYPKAAAMLSQRDAAIRRDVLETAAALCEHRAGSRNDHDADVRGGMYLAGWWRGLTTTAGMLRALAAKEAVPTDESDDRIAQLERERDAEHVRAEHAYANYVQLMRDVADERNATAETVARLERDRDRAQDTVLQQHRRAEAAEAQVAELRRELDELHATFDAQWAADMRAVARWRAEDSERRALSMPDREAMTFRLLQLLDAAEAQVAELRAALQLVQQELDDVEQDGSDVAFSNGERDIIRAALAGTPAEALARQQALARVVEVARVVDEEFADAVEGENIVAREDGSVMLGWVELPRPDLQRLSDALAALDGGARDE